MAGKKRIPTVNDSIFADKPLHPTTLNEWRPLFDFEAIAKHANELLSTHEAFSISAPIGDLGQLAGRIADIMGRSTLASGAVKLRVGWGEHDSVRLCGVPQSVLVPLTVGSFLRATRESQSSGLAVVLAVAAVGSLGTPRIEPYTPMRLFITCAGLTVIAARAGVPIDLLGN